jgi:glyoxylase-like metal-dependent hydrolase (beta-lactamase superfamily II)
VARQVERFEHEGVEGLRAGRFDIGINSSCIVYRLGTTLVDTGPPNQWPVIRRFLEEREVRRVLVTHHHEDHSGNAARLKTEMRAEVFAPERGLRAMSGGFRLRPYQHLIWGAPGRVRLGPSPEVTSLEGGMSLRAIPAPGHSPDMTCYLEPERGWLFTGDLYIASKQKFLRADEDVDDQIDSLRRILDFDFDTLFCAHRGVVTDGRRAIRAKLDYLVELRGEVRRLHGEGRSVGEIRRILLGRETLMSLLTLYHFSKTNLVRGCLAPGDK